MAPPADEQSVLMNRLRWVEGSLLQIHRLEEAVWVWQRALVDAQTRARIDEADASWRNHHDELQAYSEDRPIRVPTVVLDIQVATEGNLFLVCPTNVMRAANRLPEDLSIRMEEEEVLRLMPVCCSRSSGSQLGSLRSRSRSFADIRRFDRTLMQ